MEQQQSGETVLIVCELNPGQHTLFNLDDGGLDLLVIGKQVTYLIDNMLLLDPDETYRLFVSLQEQYKSREMYFPETGLL